MTNTPLDDLSPEEKDRLIERMLVQRREAALAAPFAHAGRDAQPVARLPRNAREQQLLSLLPGLHDVYQVLPEEWLAQWPEGPLAHALQQGFDCACEPADLPKPATIASLASFLENRDLDEPPPPFNFDLEREYETGFDAHSLMPLSPYQLRLWFFHRLEGASDAFHLVLRFRMEGPLDAWAFGEGCRRLSQRHHVLRAIFPEYQGNPRQELLPTSALELNLVDLSGLGAAEEQAERLRRKIEQTPFPQGAHPLTRLVLVRLAADLHQLVVVFHRMVADEHTADLFLQELKQHYEARLHGEKRDLPEPFQYGDFARWQWYHAEHTWGAQSKYWEQQLADCPERHQLPLDHPRPGVQGFKGARRVLRFSPKQSRALKALGELEGAGPLVVLHTAFVAFLARYSQCDTLVVGMPVSAREGHVRRILGPCCNKIALRTDLTDNPRFMDLLHQVKETVTAGLANRRLPFERVVERLSPQRDLSHSPIFQIGFRLEEPANPVHLPLLHTHAEIDNDQVCLYDFGLVLFDDGAQLTGYFEYNADLFEAATVTRMAQHFKYMLGALPLHRETPVGRLPLLSAEERETILVDWNATAINLGPRLCLHDLFQRQVNETPQATALLFRSRETGSLSYDQLNRMANRLAHHLVTLGVGPEITVGVCTRRGPALVVALLAVFKAGAAYLPLDPDHPTQRLVFMARDAGVRVILAEYASQHHFATLEGTLVSLDDAVQEMSGGQHEDNPVGTVRDFHRASVLYTSGTEGFPKGVVSTHRALVNRMRWAQEVFPMRADDRFLQVAPFSFDIALWEILAPLIKGAALVLPEPDVEQDIAELVRETADWRITAIHFIPSLLHAFLQHARIFTARHLRLVFCGGETLSLATVLQFHARLRGRLIHFYGPTEAAINITSAACRTDWQAVSIGTPIANTATYVLDRFMQPVPPGVTGELYLGGNGLARCYQGRPARTATCFVPNPFGGEHPFAPAGSRLYRTGDLARLGTLGSLYFLGRRDRQVKVNGFRLELSEVERHLNELPGVNESHVLSYEPLEGVNRLVAYVSGQGPTPGELRAALSETLPTHMIPSAFVVLRRLPLLPNGKLNRRALPKPESRWFDRNTAYAAPKTREEHVLARIWSEILGVDKVGIHDNFFQLGGNSLLIIRTETRAAEAGIHLTTRQLFQKPTIAEIVSVLGEDEELQLPEPALLHACFDQHVATDPGALAIWETHRQTSYAQLQSGANQMADRLVRMGVGRGSRVGICCEGADAVIALLAVLKSGAAALYLDPCRQAFNHELMMNGDLAVALVDFSDRLPRAAVPLLLVTPIEGLQLPAPVVDISSEDLALVCFHEPEPNALVTVTHGALLHALCSLSAVPGLEREDRMLVMTRREPLWLLWPILVGSPLVLPKAESADDAVAVNRLLLESKTGSVVLGPNSLSPFLGSLRPGDGNVRVLLHGTIPVPEARGLAQRYRQIWHFYGKAETAFCCARGLVDPRTLEDTATHVGVSGPIHGTRLYVLDEQMRLVRPGTLGALYVSGSTLARSYHGDPRLTCSRFVPDPFSRQSGGRLFKTGDRAFYLADGRVFFP